MIERDCNATYAHVNIDITCLNRQQIQHVYRVQFGRWLLEQNHWVWVLRVITSHDYFELFNLFVSTSLLIRFFIYGATCRGKCCVCDTISPWEKCAYALWIPRLNGNSMNVRKTHRHFNMSLAYVCRRCLKCIYERHVVFDGKMYIVKISTRFFVFVCARYLVCDFACYFKMMRFTLANIAIYAKCCFWWNNYLFFSKKFPQNNCELF